MMQRVVKRVGNSRDSLQDTVYGNRGLKSILSIDDVQDLELVFTADSYVFGTTETVELIENGRNIAVTNENRVWCRERESQRECVCVA
jgi:hypothetical protein